MRISDWSSTCALPIWPGIVPIYETLAAIEHKAVEKHDDKTLWNMALEGKDDLAVAALDRFCLALGAVAGDLALAHGPKGVVIAGGLRSEERRGGKEGVSAGRSRGVRCH